MLMTRKQGGTNGGGADGRARPAAPFSSAGKDLVCPSTEFVRWQDATLQLVAFCNMQFALLAVESHNPLHSTR